MKRVLYHLIPIAMLMLAAAVPAMAAPEVVPGELLVKYRSGIKSGPGARAERASVRSLVGGDVDQGVRLHRRRAHAVSSRSQQRFMNSPG